MTTLKGMTTTPEDFEKTNVHDVYQRIADSFSNTRYRVWPSVKFFLDEIPSNAKVLEVGCGNGKNLEYLKNVSNKMGCDVVPKFVEITKKKGLNCVLANGINLPFADNSFDYILSVAVVHHFSTKERRICAVTELLRVLKPQGKVFIEVWAMEQPQGTKRKFTEQDTMVPWKNNEQRYYHVFVKGELEELVTEGGGTVLKSKYDNGNWVVIGSL